MKVIWFLTIIASLYMFFYSLAIVAILIGLIFKFILFERFLHYLLIIGSFFSFFFGMILNFLNNNKTKSLLKNKTKISYFYLYSSIIIVCLLGISLLFGITLDFFNLGFNSNIELDFYFLIVQSSIGLYTSNLITDLFNLLGKLEFKVK